MPSGWAKDEIEEDFRGRFACGVRIVLVNETSQ